jgi:hypothetical protein
MQRPNATEWFNTSREQSTLELAIERDTPFGYIDGEPARERLVREALAAGQLHRAEDVLDCAENMR